MNSIITGLDRLPVLQILANAEGPDPTDSNLVIVVIATVIIAAVCILAAIPVATTRRRRGGESEGIAAVMVIWGLVAAGSAIYFANAQMVYSKEHMMQIMQNYDPRDTSGRPRYPWIQWALLVAVYVAAMVWAMTARRPPEIKQGFDVLPTSPRDPRD